MDVKHSVTSITAFQTCPQQWKLRYIDKLRPARDDAGPRSLGSAVHFILAKVLLELHHTGDQYPNYTEMSKHWAGVWQTINEPPPVAVSGVVIYDEEFREMVQIAAGIAARFLKNRQPHLNYELIEFEGVPMVEYNLETVLDGHKFVGFIDVVWRDKATGLVEIVDFKVTGRFSTWEDMLHRSQLYLYAAMLKEQTGIEANAVVFWQIRNKEAARPTLNKNGAMSRSKISTDWATYRDALLEAGLDPADYDDMRVKLHDEEHYWYQEHTYMPNAATIGRFVSDAVQVAQFIESNTEYFPRINNWGCGRCEYASWCSALLYGDEPPAIDFVIKE